MKRYTATIQYRMENSTLYDLQAEIIAKDFDHAAKQASTIRRDLDKVPHLGVIVGVTSLVCADDEQPSLNYDESGNWIGEVQNENGWTP